MACTYLGFHASSTLTAPLEYVQAHYHTAVPRLGRPETYTRSDILRIALSKGLAEMAVEIEAQAAEDETGALEEVMAAAAGVAG